MPGVLLDRISRQFGGVSGGANGGVKAVDELSLSIDDNEFVTLLGPSGCGKTTTLRMVAGLEQNDGGRISIGDKIVSDADKGLFVPPDKRELGMVFQSYAIWPHLTVFENVAYPLRVRHVAAAEITAKVGAALKLVEMESFAQRPAPLLSGGQQQRVAIARALAFEPQVLLLDEPLSNLDSKLRATMGDEFRALQRRLKITTLYVTHDQDEAMALSDRVVVMQQGRILQVGAPETIYQRPANRTVAAFFGSPNLLPAKVVSGIRIDADTHSFLVRGEGGWSGTCLAGEEFNAGDDVLVMARPENLVLADPGQASNDGQAAAWSGRVVDSIFRGPRRSMVVECAGTRMHVETPAMRTARIGDHVTLMVDAASAWAMRP
jgi:iron(III) transport system ATP-binding protein